MFSKGKIWQLKHNFPRKMQTGWSKRHFWKLLLWPWVSNLKWPLWPQVPSEFCKKCIFGIVKCSSFTWYQTTFWSMKLHMLQKKIVVVIWYLYVCSKYFLIRTFLQRKFLNKQTIFYAFALLFYKNNYSRARKSTQNERFNKINMISITKTLPVQQGSHIFMLILWPRVVNFKWPLWP